MSLDVILAKPPLYTVIPEVPEVISFDDTSTSKVADPTDLAPLISNPLQFTSITEFVTLPADDHNAIPKSPVVI